MINKTIKLLRLINGVKQKDMAHLLGISSNYLSEMEAGKKNISIDTVGIYSKIFKIETSLIFRLSEKLEKNEKKTKQEIMKAVIEAIRK